MVTWNSAATVFFGILGIVQWIQGYLKFQDMASDQRQLQTIKTSLMQFNAMCNDTETKGDHKKPAAMKRFISDAAHMAKSIEHQVDVLLGILTLVPKEPVPRMRRVIGWIFPVTKIGR